MSFAVHLHCWFSCSGYPVICAENLEADGHNASQIIPFCAWLQKLACFHHISPVGHLDSSRLATLFLAHLTIVCLSLLAMMRIFQKFVLMYHELSFLLLPVFLPIYFKTLRSRQCREACSPMENKAWEGKLEVSFHSQFFQICTGIWPWRCGYPSCVLLWALFQMAETSWTSLNENAVWELCKLISTKWDLELDAMEMAAWIKKYKIRRKVCILRINILNIVSENFR